jgi:hypothetical protein
MDRQYIDADFATLIAPSHRHLVAEILSPAHAEHAPMMCPLLLISGEPVLVSLSSSILSDDPIRYLISLQAPPSLDRLLQDIAQDRQRDLMIARLTSSFQFTAHFDEQLTLINDWISPSFEYIMGYTREQTAELTNWTQIIEPDDLPLVTYQLREVLAGRDAVAEYRLRKGDGSLCWVRAWVAADMTPADGEPITRVHGIVQEITAQVEAMLHLRDSESRLINVIRNLPIHVFTIDTDGTITFIDGSKSANLGLDPGEIVGKPSSELYGGEAEFLDDTQRVLRGEFIQRDRYYQDRVYETYYMPLYDGVGTITGALGMGMDITERRHMEQAVLEAEGVRVAWRKEIELSELKSKMMERIAHEFRTPLATIQLSTQLLERYSARMSEADRSRRLQQILERVGHLARLLDDISLVVQAKSQMLTLSRYRFDLRSLGMSLIDELRNGAGQAHDLQLTISPQAETVTADARLIGMILQNLLSNAIKFSAPATTVTVTAGVEANDLILSVQDRGIGILPDELSRVFQPFFRGSNFDERPGLGLGLSIVQDAVAQCDGRMVINSTPGEGTLVQVHIPLGSSASDHA